MRKCFRADLFNIILLFLILIYILRFSEIINSFEFLFFTVKFSFASFDEVINSLDFDSVDLLAGGILIAVIPISVLLNKSKLSKININFENITFSILLFAVIFSPILAVRHPDFQKELSVTRLLPPLSSVYSFELPKKNPNRKDNFTEVKNLFVKKSFDEMKVIFDRYKISGSEIIIWRKGKASKIDLNEFGGLQPEIKNEFFLLGADQLGRDIFSRLIYGIRRSLVIASSSVVVAILIGLSLGFIAGYFGGAADLILNRISEIFLAFPLIYLIILMISLFGNHVFSVILVLGLSSWMSVFKIVRSEIFSIKKKDFFIASKMIGVSNINLLVKDVLPLIITPVIINIIFLFGNVVLTESALSFLGLGSSINFPSWGEMIHTGQEYLQSAWWIFASPALSLVIALILLDRSGTRIEKYLNPMLKNDK